jgi:hypothetical protein
MRTINKQPKQHAFIFSVFSNNQSSDTNLANHTDLLKSLIHHAIPFKVMEGCYTYDNGTKQKELSYYIETSSKHSYLSILNFVESQCVTYNQESYLELTPKRQATLKYLKGTNTPSGHLVAVNENEALGSKAYTFCPSSNNYFVCK